MAKEIFRIENNRNEHYIYIISWYALGTVPGIRDTAVNTIHKNK